MDPKFAAIIADLSWERPKPLQEEARKAILLNLDQWDLSLLCLAGDKSCWKNEAQILKSTGYPRILPVLPRILEWYMDVNWPGFSDITELLSTVPSNELIPTLETVALKALKENDGMWIFGLTFLVRELKIRRDQLSLESARKILFKSNV
ncbi:DUF5071 domain-containing protein [Oligoflexus sp.]|uniref:DUF5071 domain-containing protein n=1 Tax=Oligoflexus sp. TaxID=1971216 RepID=UPI002D77B6F8|nr:DUF5071 domain-containing protein [Oligoflexus sp.]